MGRARPRLDKHRAIQAVSDLKAIAAGDKFVGKGRQKLEWGSVDRAFSLLPGGRAEGLAYLEMARRHIDSDGKRPNQSFDRLLEKWKFRTEWERNGCSIDELCVEAGVDPADLLAESVRFGVRHNAQLAQLVAVSLLPDTVKAVAARSRKVNGHMDARILGEATGWLPKPGSLVNQQFNISGGAVTGDMAEGERGHSLPSFESDTVESCEVVRS